jgi:hypothetical protein
MEFPFPRTDGSVIKLFCNLQQYKSRPYQPAAVKSEIDFSSKPAHSNSKRTS